MSKKPLFYFKVIVLLLITLISLQFSLIPAYSEPPSLEKVIVAFKTKIKNEDLDLIKKAGGRIKYNYSIITAVAAELPQQAIEPLRNNPRIEHINPDVKVHKLEQTTPWGITKVRAPESWPTATGSSIKVAVIDTGIDYNHPDLAANYKGGYDFVNGDNDPMDDEGHGTHVSGTVAAINNTIGVVGVAPQASIYALKVLDANGEGYISDIIAATDWAVANGMQVINMSLGYDGPFWLSDWEAASNNAYNAGLLLVAAAGNSGKPSGNGNNVEQPALYESVIAVSAIKQDETRASFSSTGPAVELAAPGYNILSTYPNNSYTSYNGTSMASPHVAGAAAVVWQAGSSLTNVQLRQVLKNTARDLGAAGKDNLYGYGLVDTYAAVASVAPSYSITASSLALEQVIAGTNTWPGVDSKNKPFSVTSNIPWLVTAYATSDFTNGALVLDSQSLQMGKSYQTVVSIPKTTPGTEIAEGAAGSSLQPNVYTTLNIPWEREDLVGNSLNTTITYTVMPK